VNKTFKCYPDDVLDAVVDTVAPLTRPDYMKTRGLDERKDRRRQEPEVPLLVARIQPARAQRWRCTAAGLRGPAGLRGSAGFPAGSGRAHGGRAPPSGGGRRWGAKTQCQQVAARPHQDIRSGALCEAVYILFFFPQWRQLLDNFPRVEGPQPVGLGGCNVPYGCTFLSYTQMGWEGYSMIELVYYMFITNCCPGQVGHNGF
jgi:hypothetical protein